MSLKRADNPFLKEILDFIDLHPEAPRKPRRLARSMAVSDRDYPAFRDAFRELRRTGRLSPRKRASKTLIGRFKATQRGFGFVIPQGPEAENIGEDVYIPLGSTGGALSGDVVLVELWTAGHRGEERRGGRRRLQGEVIEIVERGLQRVVGTLEHVDGGWFLEPDGGQLTTPVILESLPDDLRRIEGEPLSPGTKVLVEITEYPEGPGMLPMGRVTEVLGLEGTLETETMAIIVSHQLPHRFSEDALLEAKRLVTSFDPKTTDARGERVDLSGLVVITIDPDEARDYDDAVSLEDRDDGTYVLGVHIADVSHFVTPGSALDREARERGTSVYFPRQVVPMLPQGLSQGVCALAPDHDKYALSVFITYDDQGLVHKREVIRSIINSRQRLTYEEAQRICDGEAEGRTDEVTRLVRSLAQLARVIRERRIKKGMLSLDLPEVSLVLDREGKVTDARPAPHLFTHRLIEMFMVEANEAIATLLWERVLPVIRRIHPRPSLESYGILQKLASAFDQPLPEGPPSRKALQRLAASVRGRPEAYAINMAILRSLEKARYSTEEVGHFALASETYCHFTSPIRRYPDLVVHRMVSSALLADKGAGDSDGDSSERAGHESSYDVEVLEELADHCSETERRAEAAELELRQVLLLQHLAGKIGERFIGVVTGITSFGPFVQSPHFLIEGLVPRDSLDGWWEIDAGKGTMVNEATGTFLRLGDRVEVTITRVDVSQRHLDLSLGDLVETPRREPHRRRDRSATPRRRGRAPDHHDAPPPKGRGRRGRRKR